MEATRKRNITVDLLRGIAALCMILGHSFIVYPVDISAVPWCAALQKTIYSFHMELFFILAGWVYKCDSYKEYILKKVKRLLIPYFFFGFVSMLLHTFGGGAINGSVTLSEGILNLLLRGGGYWFIYTLFVLFVVYPLLERVLKRPAHKVLALILVLILDCAADFTNLFTFNTALHYLPYFILGNLIGRSVLSSLDPDASPWSKLLALSLTAYIGATILNRFTPEFLGPADAFVRAVSFSAALYALVMILRHRAILAGKLIGRLLTDASRYSLQLYLFNGYIVVAARIAVCSILHIRIPVVIVCSIFLANMILTLFACKKILPRVPVLRDLCGL